MVRLVGRTLTDNKRIVVALTQIFGVGIVRARFICKNAGIFESKKVVDLSDVEVHNIRELLSKFEVEGDLRRRVFLNIKHLKDIKCYRGIRHKMGLPVRGQRTRTNAKTSKKKRKS